MGELIRMHERQRPPVTPGRIVIPVTTPSISCHLRIDLKASVDPEEQRAAVLGLSGVPLGSSVRIQVPPGWPHPRVVNTVAYVTVDHALQLHLEGEPAAVSSWAASLRELIGHELVRGGGR